MSPGRIVMGVVGLTVVTLLVFLAMGRRDLAGVAMAVGLMVAVLVPTLAAAVRRRLGVVGLVSALIGSTFAVGLFLPAAYGKRTPTGELGFGLVIGSIVAAIVGVFVMLPFWVQLRRNRELRRARAATASLGWVWLWRIHGPSGEIDGVRVTLTEKGVTAEAPVPMTFMSGGRADAVPTCDVAALACLGPRSRAALYGLARQPGVSEVSVERGVVSVGLGPEVDGVRMAEIARRLASWVNVMRSEWGSPGGAQDRLAWCRRAIEHLRVDEDPNWRLLGLETLWTSVESPSFGDEWQRKDAKRVVESFFAEIRDDDPHLRVALFAAEKRGDFAAVGRIRARLGTAGGGLAIASNAAQSGLALSEREQP